MIRDSRVGAVLREQNALPLICGGFGEFSAKDDVDNVGAGRAAKSTNHLSPATKRQVPAGTCLLFFDLFEKQKDDTLIARNRRTLV